MKNIALYGFGRIGRQFLRIALNRQLFVPVSISDIRDEATPRSLPWITTTGAGA